MSVITFPLCRGSCPHGRQEKRKVSVSTLISDDDHSESSDDVALAKTLLKRRKVVQIKVYIPRSVLCLE